MAEAIGRSTGKIVAFRYNASQMPARNFDGIWMEITTKAMGLGSQIAAALVQVYEQWTGVPVVPRQRRRQQCTSAS